MQNHDELCSEPQCHVFLERAMSRQCTSSMYGGRVQEAGWFMIPPYPLVNPQPLITHNDEESWCRVGMAIISEIY
jgi:hypothetical protein